MISAVVQDTGLFAGRDCPLVILLTNTDQRVCRSIVFRVDLPPELAVMRGSERVDLAELDPGASYRMELIVRPSKHGTFALHSPNFGYRDGSDSPRRIRRWKAMVVVNRPVISISQRAKMRADEFASAQRWDAAWPMYLAAGMAAPAQMSLARAVATMKKRGEHDEVIAQYIAYGRHLRNRGDRQIPAHAELIDGLKQATELLRRKKEAQIAYQCQDLLAWLTEAPAVKLQIIVPPETTFVAESSSVVQVEVTNHGYGPAFDVLVTLSDALAYADRWELACLSDGRTEMWSSASIVPANAGACIVEAKATAMDNARQPVTIPPVRQKITVEPKQTDPVFHSTTNIHHGDEVNIFRQQRDARKPLQPGTCVHCGSALASTHKFCPACGRSTR